MSPDERKKSLPTKLTWLLALLLLAALGGALLAWSRLNKLSADAVASQRDLAECLHNFADIPDLASRSDGAAAAIADDPELNRQLRGAATVAGVADEIASIEPGQPKRIRDTDYTETLVFVHLNAVSLEQLVTFLHTFRVRDASVRARSIELAVPPDGTIVHLSGTTRPAVNAELWTADVALAYTACAPHAAPGQ